MADVSDNELRQPDSPQSEAVPSADEGNATDRLAVELQAGRELEANFRRLFEIQAPSVTYFFLNRGFSQQEAEDLTQEVFLKVYRKIGSFRFESSFSTWFYRIVTNTWKNAVRGQQTVKRRKESVSLDALEEPELETAGQAEPDGLNESPLDKVLSEERTLVLRTALEELPDRMRQCVILRIGQGLKYSEIAELMQISVETVKWQLREAHRRLKPLLEPNLDVLIV